MLALGQMLPSLPDWPIDYPNMGLFVCFCDIELKQIHFKLGTLSGCSLYLPLNQSDCPE